MLNTELTKHREGSAERLPQEAQQIMKDSTSQLKKSDIEKQAFNVGQKVPNDTLIDQHGKQVNFYDLFNNKPLIIDFYRGTWCPYCNLELNEYKKLLEKDSEIQMVAISPELPDVTSSELDVDALPFKVLSDVDNHFSKSLGLVFKLTDELKELYLTFGINLETSQGNTNNELPLPVTYLVDKDGVIVKAWINADYTYRAEPSEVIEAYKAISK